MGVPGEDAARTQVSGLNYLASQAVALHCSGGGVSRASSQMESMVIGYIQSGNTTREVRTSSLLHAGLQYDRRVGWKSPHLTSIIAKQRIMRLQVLVQSVGSEGSSWSYLARQAFAECMGSYHRESSFDWLFFRSTKLPSVLDARAVPPLWHNAWTHWYEMHSRLRHKWTRTLQQHLRQPLWLTLEPEYQISATPTGPPSYLLQVLHPVHRLL